MSGDDTLAHIDPQHQNQSAKFVSRPAVTPMKNIDLFDCTYCGVTAEARDHVIPASYDYTSRKRVRYGRDEVVPACKECNSKLSNKWLPSIAQRAQYIANALTRKYRVELAFPDWDDYDLEDMSTIMRKQILAKIKIRELTKARIEFAKAMAKTSLVPEDCWEK